MAFMTKKQMDKLAEKIHRQAYQAEYDAARLKNSYHPSYGEELASISRQLGRLARSMEAEIT